MPLVDSGQLENAAEQRDALGCFCGTEGWKCDTAAVIDMPEPMPVIVGTSVRMMERVGEAVGRAGSGMRRESCRPAGRSCVLMRSNAVFEALSLLVVVERLIRIALRSYTRLAGIAVGLGDCAAAMQLAATTGRTDRNGVTRRAQGSLPTVPRNSR